MVGTDPIPDEVDKDYDMVVSTGCMVRDHFPNTCFDLFIEVLKPGGLIAITSREVYLHNESDNGMDYIGALRKLSDRGIMEDTEDKEGKKLTLLHEMKFRKYDGLEEIEGVHQEDARVLIYRKN